MVKFSTGFCIGGSDEASEHRIQPGEEGETTDSHKPYGYYYAVGFERCLPT